MAECAVCSIRKNLTIVGQQVFSDGAQLCRHDISSVKDRVKSTKVKFHFQLWKQRKVWWRHVTVTQGIWGVIEHCSAIYV